MNRRRAWIAAQLLFVVALVLFLGFALRDIWADAGPMLRHADPRRRAIATALIAPSMPVRARLAAHSSRAGCPDPVPVALQAEMPSMLAKYVPGGIWTPTARVVGSGRPASTGHARRALVDLARGRALAISGVGRLRRRESRSSAVPMHRSFRWIPSPCLSPSCFTRPSFARSPHACFGPSAGRPPSGARTACWSGCSSSTRCLGRRRRGSSSSFVRPRRRRRLSEIAFLGGTARSARSWPCSRSSRPRARRP